MSNTFSDAPIGVNALSVFTGEYDPTSDASDDDNDPGDLISLTGLTQWKLSPAVMLMPMLTYSHTGVERINGAKRSQDGDVWSVSGAMRYARPPFEFGASLRHILTRPNQEWREDALREEAANSNAQKWGVAVSVAYQPSPTWMIGLTGDVGDDTESDRRNETSGLPYDGRQTRDSHHHDHNHHDNDVSFLSSDGYHNRQRDRFSGWGRDIYERTDRDAYGERGGWLSLCGLDSRRTVRRTGNDLRLDDAGRRYDGNRRIDDSKPGV